MSVKGHYELELTCDEKVPERCKTSVTISDETRGQAKELARMNGWFLGKGDRAFCPQHAAKRRGE